MEPLALAEALLRLPTAPFVEDLPARFCLEQAAELGLPADRDAAGNVVVRSGEGPQPLVLVAHLDHPAFVVDEPLGDRVGLTFRGGVGLAHAAAGEAPLTFFRPGEPAPCGQGRLVAATGAADRLTGGTAEVDEGEAPPGSFAMWGFPGWSVADGRITARVCDDLLGVAAALACLAQIDGAARRPVWALFTRAEEDGLLGAFEAARLGTVPTDADVVSLECSKALPEAPQGAGVVVRVGDRMSVFDDTLTDWVRGAAEAAGVRHRRKLMDGGVCEATVFTALGYRATGLAVPLGNYHNALDDGVGIGPEHVLVDDWLAEVDLLVALASRAPAERRRSLSAPLAERAARARELLGAEAPGA